MFIIFQFFTKIKIRIMKKFISLLSITMIMLTSCSKEDFEDSESITEKTNPNGTILRKTIAITNGDISIVTGDYVYNGNKLSKIITSDDKYVAYFYTNDLITSKEFYTNTILDNKEIFEYNANNQLVNFKRVKANNSIVYRAIFVYNPDGTISVTGYKDGLTDQNSEINKRKIFVQNGRVVKTETYVNVNGTIKTTTNQYSFDTKNSPFQNILGFDKLTYYDVTLGGSSNNITGLNITNSTNSNSRSTTTQYTYNALNFPVTAKEVDAANINGSSTLFQFFYK